MQANPQKRRNPHEAGFDKTVGLGGLCRNDTTSIEPIGLAAISHDRIPALLNHHASYIDCFLLFVCADEPIGIPGRQALAYTSDRLRQIAEVLR